MEQRQTPCPNRCLDDLGGAFAMGAVGGTVWHAGKAWRNAPIGQAPRFILSQIKAKGPTLGGNFAVWGGLFSFFDCTITSVRHVEDPLNAITAGALTGGILAARAGPKAAAFNAVIGGALLGLIEGLGFVMGRVLSPAAVQPMAGMPGGNLSGGPNLANLAALQPRRTLAPVLDEAEEDRAGTAASASEEMNLEEAGAVELAPAAFGKSTPKSNSSTASKPSASQYPFLNPQQRRPAPVVYSAAAEFSPEDFSFNDADDFEE
jgi:import inner membrane translocase subunit TIM17